MADSDARTGFGALLQKGTGVGSPPDFLTILGIKSIDGPSISRDTGIIGAAVTVFNKRLEVLFEE